MTSLSGLPDQPTTITHDNIALFLNDSSSDSESENESKKNKKKNAKKKKNDKKKHQQSQQSQQSQQPPKTPYNDANTKDIVNIGPIKNSNGSNMNQVEQNTQIVAKNDQIDNNLSTQSSSQLLQQQRRVQFLTQAYKYANVEAKKFKQQLENSS